jgi:hypothetical protein
MNGWDRPNLGVVEVVTLHDRARLRLSDTVEAYRQFMNMREFAGRHGRAEF